MLVPDASLFETSCLLAVISRIGVRTLGSVPVSVDFFVEGVNATSLHFLFGVFPGVLLGVLQGVRRGVLHGDFRIRKSPDIGIASVIFVQSRSALMDFFWLENEFFSASTFSEFSTSIILRNVYSEARWVCKADKLTVTVDET